jgi:radical SAM superfamily enzyme YgiQ (UPF0313 family)
MVGLPEQDMKSINDTINSLHKIEKYIDELEVSIYVPYPGTELFNKVDDYGIIKNNINYKRHIPRSEYFSKKGTESGIYTKWLSRDEIVKARYLIENSFPDLLRKNKDNLYMSKMN